MFLFAGRGSGGAMSTSEAGKKGGETVKQKYGPEFFSEIGRKGGRSRGSQRQRGGSSNE